MSSKPDQDFLMMFDALLLVDSAAAARDLARDSDLIENLEFHSSAEETEETDSSSVPEEQENK